MKIRVEVQMLAMVVALYLALGMSDGLVIDKCELGDELNSTLPAKLLDRITNLVAKIVCHVELSSHFNTSTINHVTGPNIHSFIRGGHGGRKGRSAESSSEESSEENIQVPKHGFNSSVVNPVTHLHGNNSSSGEGHRGRKGRSAESSSEESSEEDTEIPQHNPVTHSQGNNSASGTGHRRRSASESSSKESSEEDIDSSNGAGHRKRSASGSSSEESSEENIQVPKHGFNSSVVNPVTHLHGNNSSSEEGHRGRKGRSAESSSEESSEEDTEIPQHNPVTHSQGNNSASGTGHRRRSASESSSKESSEEDIDSSNGAGHRKRSASGSSSEESSEENIQVPKHGFNSSVVNPVTHLHGNNSSSGEGHRGRKGRSAESSSKESEERNTWTLYGLFQLPDRIACTSGLEPSLNVCNMACDRLIDDNIRDDITCVETIINKMFSEGRSHGPNKALFSKLLASFFQKECKNVEDFEYFSTC